LRSAEAEARMADMIEVYRIPLSKERLHVLSKEERSLFFLLGYISNQITLNQKMVTFSTNRVSSDPVEQMLTGAQTQMMARNMVGVLKEGWDVIHRRYVGKPIGQEYTPLLDTGGAHALAELKRHFGGSNLLATVRTNFVYHHPKDDDVDAAFEAATRDAELDGEWNWYLSASLFNSLYLPCDFVILHGILKAVNAGNLREAQEKLMGEVRKVADLMNEFIPAFLAAVWRRHFGEELPAGTHKVDGAPSVWDVTIPFFVEMSDPPEDAVPL